MNPFCAPAGIIGLIEMQGFVGAHKLDLEKRLEALYFQQWQAQPQSKQKTGIFASEKNPNIL